MKRMPLSVLGFAALGIMSACTRGLPEDAYSSFLLGSATSSAPGASMAVSYSKVVVVDTTKIVTSESGTTYPLTVVLSAQPSCTITLGPITSSRLSEAIIAPASLTFNSSNWNIPQTLTITGQPDNVADGSQPFQISFGSTSGCSDPAWNNVSPPLANGVNQDYWNLASNYTRSLPAGVFASISALPAATKITTFAPNLDDGEATIPIGFNFSYMDPSSPPYNTVTVGTNGYLTFDTGYAFSPATSANNSNLFLPYSGLTRPSRMVAPWWDDLVTSGVGPAGFVWYLTSGVAPNRVLTVEWNTVTTFAAFPAADTYTFQVKLYETTNAIEFVYGPAVLGGNVTAASTGLSDVLGGNAHFRDAFDLSTTYTLGLSDGRTFANFGKVSPAVASPVVRFIP